MSLETYEPDPTPPMIRLCLFLALLLGGGQTLVAEDAKPIILDEQAMQGGSVLLPAKKWGHPFQWKVLPEKLPQVPNWMPGTGPIPLDAHAAAVAATRWINAQPWAKQFDGFDGINLVSHPGPSNSANATIGFWYYKLEFNVKRDKDHRYPHAAVVLLDGTVVEPTVPVDAPTDSEP